ncbi:MAG: transposase [Deltaproteobacteria bacterium]|nr:transposase [Deltaproteobacteria bacterium]
MARPLRIEYDGAFYHVTSRGNERKAIFKDDSDRNLFLAILGQVIERFHWLCHAYCLMGNHYHLVIETPDANLSRGMRQLNGVYTQAFNRRHRRVGHLFQGRFKGILVEKDSQFLEVCRYVVLNAVAAEMVKQAGGWAWSSYRATVGEAVPEKWLTVDEILGQFGKRRRDAQRKYRQFVREGIGRPSIWEKLAAHSLLGEEGFAEGLKGYVRGYETITEIPRGQRLIGRPSLKQLFGAESHSQSPRARLIEKAVQDHGYSQVEVAPHLKIHYSTLSRIMKRLRQPAT